MANVSLSHAPIEHDPAILALIKCHVTTFLRWDLLRHLADNERRWLDAEEVARAIHKPQSAIETTLGLLEREGLVETSRTDHGAVAYRMDPQGPSTRVVERLVAGATRSQELRQIIVAQILAGERLAS